MKKMFCVFMMICLLCSAALAQGMEPAYAGQKIELGERTAIDLDGDGQTEDVLVQMEGSDGEEELALYVFGADGGVEHFTIYMCRMTGAFAVDLDQDGVQELLISGDFYSDDYATYAFHYGVETGLTQLNFTNVCRGEAEEPVIEYGYGMVTNVEGNRITLTGSQDVLGTWMASREFTLQDGQFVTDDDGLWRMLDLTDDEESWEWRALNPLRSISATLEDGTEGSIEAGESFMVTASDRESIVYFVTRDGKTGSFAIAPNFESGWGSLIDGVSEDEIFEFVPYAD